MHWSVWPLFSEKLIPRLEGDVVNSVNNSSAFVLTLCSVSASSHDQSLERDMWVVLVTATLLTEYGRQLRRLSRYQPTEHGNHLIHDFKIHYCVLYPTCGCIFDTFFPVPPLALRQAYARSRWHERCLFCDERSLHDKKAHARQITSTWIIDGSSSYQCSRWWNVVQIAESCRPIRHI